MAKKAVIGKVTGGFAVLDEIDNAVCHEKIFRDNIKFYTPKEPHRISCEIECWLEKRSIVNFAMLFF